MKIADIFDNPNPNAIGEWLRAYTFDCKEGEYGCYSCFEVKPSFKPLVDDGLIGKCLKALTDFCFEDNESEEVLEVLDNSSFFYEKGLIVAWYWECDGTLLFFDAETGKGVVNDDCKKDHYWKEIQV